MYFTSLVVTPILISILDLMGLTWARQPLLIPGSSSKHSCRNFITLVPSFASVHAPGEPCLEDHSPEKNSLQVLLSINLL